MTRPALLWLLLSVSLVTALAVPLNKRGFVSGDQGVKLIMAVEATRHPARPLEIDLPSIGHRPVLFLDRFFVQHRDHAHGLQSPLFPLITAPLLTGFGLSGLYVLPALGFVALWPLLYAWNRQRGSQAPTWALGVVTVAANPLFFYAFEFWEHTAAVALLTASAVIGGDDGRRQSASGVLAGMAVLLRPEAIWWAAIWVAVAPRTRASFVAGLAAVGGAFVGLNVAEGAPPLGFHAAANVDAMADAWLLARLHRFEAWLFPASPWFISALVTAFVGGVLRRTGGVESARLAGLAAAVLVAAGSVSGDFPRDSLWRVFPIGGLLLTASAYADRRDLVLLWGTAAAVLLTSTHDGGAQWGPRILLIVTPVLLLCAASALSDAIAPGRLQTLRFALVGLLICCGAWTSRHAYVDLRGWKRYYGTLAQSLERESNTGDYIVTNTWWLDQVAATLYPSRTFLVASTPAEMTDVLDRLHDAGIEKIRVAWSDEPGEAGAPLLDGSCYRFESRQRLSERQVTIATATTRLAGNCDATESEGRR